MNIQQLMSSSNTSYHPLDGAGPKHVRAEPHPAVHGAELRQLHELPRERPGDILGPHGSAFAPILKANYTITDGQAESAFQYALCYLCHNRSTVLSPSSFTLHQLHVSQQRETCYICHDSHGSTQYPHLIFFNPKMVLGNSRGQLNYQSLGLQHGQCNLLCHGVDHVNRKY